MSQNKVQTFSSDIISNTKGNITKLINKNSITFKKFGEVYSTRIKPNKIKAWKMHLKMHSNLFVLVGKVQFVTIRRDFNNNLIYDSFIISQKDNNHILIPKKIIFGFKCLDKKESLIINFASIVHDKNESINFKLTDFQYGWK